MPLHLDSTFAGELSTKCSSEVRKRLVFKSVVLADVPLTLRRRKQVADVPLPQKGWPGPSAEMCRGFLLYKLWKILLGIFLEDFSGHFLPQKY